MYTYNYCTMGLPSTHRAVFALHLSHWITTNISAPTPTITAPV